MRYNDQRNFYKPAVEYIEDIDGIRKYGIREVEIDAIGCTSRGQAIRFGRWALLTETLETETVSFIAGIGESSYLKPGDVFGVIDNNQKLSRYAGRTTRYQYDNNTNQTYITLDDAPDLNLGINYVLELMTPSYNYDPAVTEQMNSTQIEDIRRGFIQSGFFQVTTTNVATADNKSTIIFNGQPFDTNNYAIVDDMVWSIHMNSGLRTYDYLSQFPDRYTDYYRVVNIEEKDQQEYQIVGLQYNPQKYIEIESGLNFERYVMQVTNPDPPEYTYTQTLNTSIDTQKARIAWINKATYQNNTNIALFVSKAGLNEISNITTPSKKKLHSLMHPSDTEILFEPSETGVYEYSIWGYDVRNDMFSASGISGTFIINNLTPIKDVVVGGLTLTTGEVPVFDRYIGVSRSTKRMYEPSPTFAWQMGVTGESLAQNFEYRLTIRKPSYSNTPDSLIYYEYAKNTVSSEGLTHQFRFEDNISASGGPFREYDVVVEAVDSSFRTSAGNIVDPNITGYIETWSNPYGYDILYVSNQRITGLYLSQTGNTLFNGYSTRQFVDTSLKININFISGILDEDIAGAYIYFSTGLFSGANITGISPISSNYNIFTGVASYDSSISAFYCPLPHESRWMKQTGYVCLSVYDSFDAELIKYNPMLRTGLPLTNIVNINFSGSTDNMRVGSIIEIFNHEDNNNNWGVKTKIIDGRRTIVTSHNNEDFIINSEN